MLVLFLLTTPVQFGPGWVFLAGAYHALKRGAANMDVLVALGTLAAYLFSVFVCVRAMASNHAGARGSRVRALSLPSCFAVHVFVVVCLVSS
jgi:cation transport ATPase